jgi:hypothetical protein
MAETFLERITSIVKPKDATSFQPENDFNVADNLKVETISADFLEVVKDDEQILFLTRIMNSPKEVRNAIYASAFGQLAETSQEIVLVEALDFIFTNFAVKSLLEGQALSRSQMQNALKHMEVFFKFFEIEEMQEDLQLEVIKKSSDEIDPALVKMLSNFRLSYFTDYRDLIDDDTGLPIGQNTLIPKVIALNTDLQFLDRQNKYATDAKSERDSNGYNSVFAGAISIIAYFGLKRIEIALPLVGVAGIYTAVTVTQHMILTNAKKAAKRIKSQTGDDRADLLAQIESENTEPLAEILEYKPPETMKREERERQAHELLEEMKRFPLLKFILDYPKGVNYESLYTLFNSQGELISEKVILSKDIFIAHLTGGSFGDTLSIQIYKQLIKTIRYSSNLQTLIPKKSDEIGITTDEEEAMIKALDKFLSFKSKHLENN